MPAPESTPESPPEFLSESAFGSPLGNVQLEADSQASRYVKDEIVDVVFARTGGELLSREGPNRYRAGDALVTGSTGDRWSVSRERFDLKYESCEPGAGNPGGDGRFRARPLPVLARQMPAAFSIARSTGGDLLHGQARDWLLQYAPGDYGVVEQARFERVYRVYRPIVD